MIQHRGEIIEKAIRQNGYSITKLAKRLGKSRRWVYYIFESNNVPLDVVLEIGLIIHYDFTNEIKELKKYKQTHFNSTVLQEPEGKYSPNSSVEYWKDKYLNLLEKYNALLQTNNTKAAKKVVRKK